MTDNNETVAVPVELLQRLRDEQDPREAIDEVAALIPKPHPKMVAYVLDEVAEQYKPLGALLAQDSPDLLTLLDAAIDDWWGSDQSDDDNALKSFIRIALGD